MMYLWIILWLVFALAVFTALGWSLNITLAQNKAWGEFAAKYKLAVAPKLKMLDPVSVSGLLNNRRINIYVSTEPARRTASVYSHIEVILNHNPGVAMFAAKKPLPVAVFRNVRLAHIYTAPGIDWAVRETQDVYAMSNWMTPARTQALKNYMDSAGKEDEPIFVSDGNQAFLLWRTVDPLRDPRILNALVQRLFGIAKELDAGAAPMENANASSAPTPDMPVSTT